MRDVSLRATTFAAEAVNSCFMEMLSTSHPQSDGGLISLAPDLNTVRFSHKLSDSVRVSCEQQCEKRVADHRTTAEAAGVKALDMPYKCATKEGASGYPIASPIATSSVHN